MSDSRPSQEPNARGQYNISIHQSYRLNGSDYYTIFDLPINVSNSIPLNVTVQNNTNPAPGPLVNDSGKTERVSCGVLENKLLDYNSMINGTKTPQTQPYIGGPVLVGNYAGANGSPGKGLASAQQIPGALIWTVLLLLVITV